VSLEPEASGLEPRASNLAEQVRGLPRKPGIYVFRDSAGKVLYVGKSRSLRDRVSSYFSGQLSSARIELMVSRIAALETFVVVTEEEALILEYELINRYEPRFNVVFRDDKSYPLIKVTREEFPRASYTRKVRKDGGLYLGPYPNAGAVRKVVDLVVELFKLRTCSYPSSRLRGVKLCLQYHIQRCTGPCEGKVSPEEYGQQVKDAVAFLRGREEELVRELEERMRGAAAALEFEKAARLRDRLQAVRALQQRQTVSRVSEHEGDLVAVVGTGGWFCVQQVNVRGGRIAGQRKLEVPGEGRGPAEVLGEFVKLHYLNREQVPPEILLSEPIPELELLESSLARRCGRKVSVRVPERGRWRQLMEMAVQNARLFLEARESQTPEVSAIAGMQELKERLGLPELPVRIEGFDISTLQGGSTVASMVSFADGVSDRASYRRFRIKEVEGQDDFASMFEVVSRRYRRLQDEGAELPRLILIDGGKGQLAAAAAALANLGAAVPICSLAKREEVIFSPLHPEGLALGPYSAGRRLLERVRDEAHRFAVTYHRKLRQRRAMTSFLDDIQGVGPATRVKLIRAFGDPRKIKEAGLPELCAVVNRRAAEAIYRKFHP
jgi:excinuclease ABC subunit C